MLRLTPLHREHRHNSRGRLVFRLSSTHRRLLAQMDNGIVLQAQQPSSKAQWLLSVSHKGVHCCGTVEDSHLVGYPTFSRHAEQKQASLWIWLTKTFPIKHS